MSKKELNKSFTRLQLEAIEDIFHETTLWHCDQCGTWFEHKEDLLEHYEVKLDENIIQNDEPSFEIFCNHDNKGKSSF